VHIAFRNSLETMPLGMTNFGKRCASALQPCSRWSEAAEKSKHPGLDHPQRSARQRSRYAICRNGFLQGWILLVTIPLGTLVAVGAPVTVRNGFGAGPVPNRRRRPWRLLIAVPGRLISIARWLVSIAIRRRPATSDSTITPRVRPRVGSVASIRIITVVMAVVVRRPGVAPLDILAFEVATLVNKARSRA